MSTQALPLQEQRWEEFVSKIVSEKSNIENQVILGDFNFLLLVGLGELLSEETR